MTNYWGILVVSGYIFSGVLVLECKIACKLDSEFYCYTD